MTRPIPERFRIALRRARPLALPLALAGGLAVGCDPNATSPLLAPTGGTGACPSAFNTIQMTGDFTSPGFSIPISPHMTLARVDGVCVWRVTVRLNAGTVLFKFLTNGDFDATPDFGGSETVTLPIPGGPHPTEQVTGTGTAIKISVPTTGLYTFTLDENARTWTAVAEGAAPTGGIAGSVSFTGLSSPPFPVATISVYRGVALAATTTSDPTTRAFSVTSLADTTYRVEISAPCYTTETLPAVDVGDAVVNVGDVALDPGSSAFNSIQMAGDFTTPPFNLPASPAMTPVDGCTWSVTVSLPAGQVLFKFVADGNFDTAYGGDEAVALDVPGGPYPTELVSGVGTAIKVNVATAGNYTFTLNENTLEWTAESAGSGPTGGIAGTVSFENIATAPFPVARVEVFSGATSVATTTTDPTTRAFSVTGLASGTYSVIATASGFNGEELPAVNVTGATVDVGELALTEGPSAHATIDVVGGFNLFTPGVNPMVESPTAVWTEDVVLNAGVFNLKFLTDGQFDQPTDYGGDESVTIDVPGGGITRPVSGAGTAIRISVANPGTYRFVLDERRQQWSATLVTPAPTRAEAR